MRYYTGTEKDSKRVYTITDEGRKFLAEQEGLEEEIKKSKDEGIKLLLHHIAEDEKKHHEILKGPGRAAGGQSPAHRSDSGGHRPGAARVGVEAPLLQQGRHVLPGAGGGPKPCSRKTTSPGAGYSV
jgi:hypothetical protein